MDDCGGPCFAGDNLSILFAVLAFTISCVLSWYTYKSLARTTQLLLQGQV